MQRPLIPFLVAGVLLFNYSPVLADSNTNKKQASRGSNAKEKPKIAPKKRTRKRKKSLHLAFRLGLRIAGSGNAKVERTNQNDRRIGYDDNSGPIFIAADALYPIRLSKNLYLKIGAGLFITPQVALEPSADLTDDIGFEIDLLGVSELRYLIRKTRLTLFARASIGLGTLFANGDLANSIETAENSCGSEPSCEVSDSIIFFPVFGAGGGLSYRISKIVSLRGELQWQHYNYTMLKIEERSRTTRNSLRGDRFILLAGFDFF